ncbi:uncharacterized protein LOC124282075 [Haliotis rubra]|uniref:uncharacterized protein LOC124282075 n=1 Tax=Haliotis rubra TaxID=36100 RepID=UPI001EE5120A|nr:uncharacterized protein LOC124282075 [Haliotis rubra]
MFSGYKAIVNNTPHLTFKMAATWAVTLLLVGYFSVCNGTVCSVSRRSSINYRSIYYKVYMYCSNICCGTIYTRYCCILSKKALLGLKISGGVLAVILLLVLLCYILYCSIKNRRPRRRRVTHPPTRPRVTSSGISRGIEPGYGKKPITHYPMPPSIKANDLTNGSSGPVHPPGQNSYGGQINTRTLPPGTIHPPPSVPAPAWQAPSPRGPSE